MGFSILSRQARRISLRSGMTPWPVAQLAGAAEGAAGTATTATSGTLSSAARKRKSLLRRSRTVAPTLISARPEDPLAVSTMSCSRCVPRIGLTSVAKNIQRGALEPSRSASTATARSVYDRSPIAADAGPDVGGQQWALELQRSIENRLLDHVDRISLALRLHRPGSKSICRRLTTEGDVDPGRFQRVVFLVGEADGEREQGEHRIRTPRQQLQLLQKGTVDLLPHQESLYASHRAAKHLVPCLPTFASVWRGGCGCG